MTSPRHWSRLCAALLPDCSSPSWSVRPYPRQFSRTRELGQETELRDDLASAVADFFARLPVVTPAPLDPSEERYLSELADFVTRARSAVTRSGHSDEVRYVPGHESLGRVLRVLIGLVGGLRAIGAGPITTWDLVSRTALDSIPALRLRCLRALLPEREPAWTSAVGDRIGYPTKTVLRALEDLAAHGLIVGDGRNGQGWSLTAARRERMLALDVETWGTEHVEESPPQTPGGGYPNSFS